MRVLLLQPDYPRTSDTGEALQKKLLPARSLLELAGRLKLEGHEVTVLDSLTALGMAGEPRLDFELALEKLFAEKRFDAAGIAVYTPLRKEAHEAARKIKRLSRLCPVIAGGPHASRLGKDLIQEWPEIDYACLGGSEQSLPSLLQSLSGKGPPAFRVGNLAYRVRPSGVRQNGKSVFDVDMKSLPPVSYRQYLGRVPGGKVERAYVMASRGCAHWCNFCSAIWKKMLLADPAAVADEIEFLVREAGAKTIVFYDDCFGQNPEHAKKTIAAVAAKRLPVSLQASTTFDSMSPDWMAPFKEAGGRDIIVGLESGARKLRKRMNKHFHDGVICRAVEDAKKLGFRLAVSVMFGFPGEQDQDVRETYRLLKKIDPEQVTATVFNITPGDLLFEFGTSLGDMALSAWSQEDQRIMNGLTGEDLDRCVARAVFFDRSFTREVILPEHDGADFILGTNPADIEKLIEKEQENWK